MCKEMPVIPINKVVDPKKNNQNKKMEGRGGREAQGVADQNNMYINIGPRKTLLFHLFAIVKEKRSSFYLD
jgi:hypothetical protein